MTGMRKKREWTVSDDIAECELASMLTDLSDAGWHVHQVIFTHMSIDKLFTIIAYRDHLAE